MSDNHKHEHHISTPAQLWAVGGALIVLTIVTVLFARVIHLPYPFNIITALAIAFTKAGLVAAFFMNLYWDVKFNLMLLIASLALFVLMVAITLLDTLYRIEVVPSF